MEGMGWRVKNLIESSQMNYMHIFLTLRDKLDNADILKTYINKSH